MTNPLELVDDNGCFVCGQANPIGLRLRFAAEAGRATTTLTLDRWYQGYAGIAHGGVVAALLDEAMAYAAISLGRWAATAEMTVRYLRPVPMGEPLCLEAHVTRDTARLAECAAELRNRAGEPLARATAKLVKGALLSPAERARRMRQAEPG